MSKNILLLGVYGMEVVEVGGTLLKNSLSGGKSEALMMICSDVMQEQVTEASKILQTHVEYTNHKIGHIVYDLEHKLPLIEKIRAFKPDVIITQDPEHSIEDFDPDRRICQQIILESISLASRDFMEEELGDACELAEIYFMSPKNPNAIVNISDVWEEKEASLNCLESQLEYSAEHYDIYFGPEVMSKVVPGWLEMSQLEKGINSMKEFNRSLYLSNGQLDHGHFAFAEAFRKVGLFHLEHL